MKRNISSLFILIPLATLAACSSDADPTEPSSTDLAAPTAETASVDPSVVASVDVGYGTVTFHEFKGEDGSTAIAVGQMTSNTYGWTPLHDTMAVSTNLELFLALVPGQEPPKSYVRAHASQATQLGRATSDILTARFNADAPIEKTTTICKSWITPQQQGCYTYTYTAVEEEENKKVLYGLTLQTTKRYTTSGVCNDGTHNVTGRLKWAPAGTTNYNDPGWTPAISPGAGWVWFGAVALGAPVCNSDGLCDEYPMNVKWRVEGKSSTGYASNTFDLRGAIIATATLRNVNGCIVE